MSRIKGKEFREQTRTAPVTDQVGTSWDEIMADVRAAREEIKSKGVRLRPNPILEERRRRKKATLKNHAPEETGAEARQGG